MLFNSYSYEILYEQFSWIYLQEDIKLLLITVNNRLKSEIEIVHDLSCHPIVSMSVLRPTQHINGPSTGDTLRRLRPFTRAACRASLVSAGGTGYHTLSCSSGLSQRQLNIFWYRENCAGSGMLSECLRTGSPVGCSMVSNDQSAARRSDSLTTSKWICASATLSRVAWRLWPVTELYGRLPVRRV